MLLRIRNLFSRVKQSKDGRTLFANFGYLTLLQVAGYVFPLITMPYLARVIGVDGFGKIAFASAIIVWFQTIADWGFNLTATRDVAKNRDNSIKVSEIFSNVFWARCFLCVISFLLLVVLIILVPKFQQNAAVILVTFLMIPGHIMFPDWYFQAVEKMKYTTILNLLFKFIFTISIFVFIKDANDYILQPLLTSLGYVFCGIIAMYIITIKWGIKLHFTPIKDIFKTIKASTDVFINTIFPNIYNAFSTILLGLMGGTAANGILDAGSKFESIVRQFISVISRTFFPFLSRRIDKHYMYARIHIIISVISCLLLLLCAPLLIKWFFTKEFYGAIPVLRIMSLSIIFLALSSIYGSNYLIIIGREKELRNLTMGCSICGFLLSFILIGRYSYIGAALTITATRAMLGFGSLILAKRAKKY